MAEYGPNPGPLPARDFCNSWGEGNPVLGKGALGNPDKKHMYYTGNDRAKQVTTVQTMLQELGYDVGSSGPDGKFGNNTEKAVMAFQQDHRDWNGEGLKVDGLVGPETADALNRMMVGRWYDHYFTPSELSGKTRILTATAEKMKSSFDLGITNEQSLRIALMQKDFNDSTFQKVTIKLLDIFTKPLSGEAYTLEIDDMDFNPVTGTTDLKGFLSENIPGNAKTGKLTLKHCSFKLYFLDRFFDPIEDDTVEVMQLGNLGYGDLPDLSLMGSGDNQRCKLNDSFKCAVMEFQSDNDIEPSGEFDPETRRKMEEIHG